jgi:uncharacterized protein (TIGR00730 family)
MIVLIALTTTDFILWMPDALHTFLTVWLFFVGGCVGSFLNVVVYRLPIGMSVSRSGSRCPVCRHPIRWYDNVPIFSWINLRAKCRDCHTPISGRYPFVELLVAVVFLFLAFGEGFQEGGNLPPFSGEPILGHFFAFEGWSIYTYHVVLVVTLIAAALIQFDGERVPWRLFLPALVVGVLGPVVLPHLHPVSVVAAVGSGLRVVSLSDALLGLLVGFLLGVLGQSITWSRRRAAESTSPHFADRIVTALPVALGGVFLGWQAISVIASFAGLTVLVRGLISRVAPLFAKWSRTADLALLSLLYIANWGELVERFPPLGPSGGLEVAGLAVMTTAIAGALLRWTAPLHTRLVIDGFAGAARRPAQWMMPSKPQQCAEFEDSNQRLTTTVETRFAREDMTARKDEENLQAILSSPSYLPVEQDVEFLTQPEVRPVRLQLELLKPEIGFARENVISTIVVFGGTQVVPLEEAQERLRLAQSQLDASPEDATCQRKLQRAERVVAKAKYYDAAREFARLVSAECQRDDNYDYVITTGGGPGVMEAANRGAYDVGAKSIGLNIAIPEEQVPNAYITPDLCFQFHYFALRKMHFLMRAKALVVFPGGFGTLDELFDALTLRQTHRMQEIPIILFGGEYWRNVINFQFLADEGVVADADLDLISFAETAEDAWRIIREYHGDEQAGGDQAGC